MKSYESMTKNELIALLRAFERERNTALTETGRPPIIGDMYPNDQLPESQWDEMREDRHYLEGATDSCAAFFDFAPLGFVALDARGVIREINLAAAEMLGRERSLLLNTPFISHVIKSDRKKILCHLERCKQSDDKIISSISITMERGNFFHLRAHSIVVKDTLRNAPLFLTALNDVSEVMEIRSLAEALTLAEERFRHSIASNLREEVLEFIAMALVKMDKFAVSVESSEQLAALEMIRESIDIAVRRIESLVRQICPANICETGLERALRALVEMAREEQNIPAEFQCELASCPVDEETRTIIFQVVRELLENAATHSRAKKIGISLSMKRGNIVVKVEDNGIGLDRDLVAGPKRDVAGYGLINVRRRIEHLGGVVRIDAVPGSGTCITLTAPLKEGRLNEFQDG